MSWRELPCGCVTCNNSVAYCRFHSAKNPPGKPAREPEADTGPRGEWRSGRRRWSPESGECEPETPAQE